MVNPELAAFVKQWLQQDSKRPLPELLLRDRYLKIDGMRITKEISMNIIAEWLKSQKYSE